ncbi:AzlC family ABC transporter permease [Kiloniella majae]|uniref:AzlC family ABC transporter permease n=1 Tax=Kiloniella majae TaxID=1938558 RepID=UPI000A278DC5|nr:AzlC family ABC transporter permease [Kiloniella majae]
MKQGFLSILPLAAGAAAYGFAFGVIAAQLDFPWWGIAIMSASVHAGSSQIVAVEQFASEGFVIGAVLAGLALNMRYLGIIASLNSVLKEVPLFQRLFAIHITSDENWALTFAKRAKDPSIGAPFLIGSGLTMFVTWIISTTGGALLGQSIPNLVDYGLGFAFTAAFIAMARAMWRNKQDTLPWIITFVVTILLIKLSMGSAFAIIAGSIAGVITTGFTQQMSKKVAA